MGYISTIKFTERAGDIGDYKGVNNGHAKIKAKANRNKR